MEGNGNAPYDFIPISGDVLLNATANSTILVWSFIELFSLFYGFLIHQGNFAMILADEVLQFYLRSRSVVTLQAKILQIWGRAEDANVGPPWEVMRRVFTLVSPPPGGNVNLGFPFPPFQPLGDIHADAGNGNMVEHENAAAAAAAGNHQDAAAAAGNNQVDALAFFQNDQGANLFGNILAGVVEPEDLDLLQVNEENVVEDVIQDIENMADAADQQAHIELMAAAQNVAQQQVAEQQHEQVAQQAGEVVVPETPPVDEFPAGNASSSGDD